VRILAGVFFMLCSYSEVLGFRGEILAAERLHQPAASAGQQSRHFVALGVAIDFGALVSMFACVLACTTAAARVLMKMAHGKLLPTALERPIAAMALPAQPSRFPPGSCSLTDAFWPARRAGLGHVRLARLALGLRISHRLRPGGRWRCPSRAAPRPALALGRGPQRVTVVVMILIVVFDLRSATDAIMRAFPGSTSATSPSDWLVFPAPRQNGFRANPDSLIPLNGMNAWDRTSSAASCLARGLRHQRNSSARFFHNAQFERIG
jgi:hypothetical protein